VGAPDFSTEELLEQARGNQTAVWHLAVRRASEREGSVEDWASYIGEDFAPSWDEMGDDPSALDVARQAAMNIATTADMQVVDLEGDDARAVVTVDGPEQEWIDAMKTTAEDLDRVNEVIFRAIASRRGLSYSQEREGGAFRMIFAK
jgi:hypothetical protein